MSLGRSDESGGGVQSSGFKRHIGVFVRHKRAEKGKEEKKFGRKSFPLNWPRKDRDWSTAPPLRLSISYANQ